VRDSSRSPELQDLGILELLQRYPCRGSQARWEVVKKTLAVMQCAGMYDNTGVFTLEVGLPAKSAFAGSVMVVLPNLMGFATFSPRLDSFGNSVRGVAFCRDLVDRFTFHVYESLSGGRTGCKQDPRESQHNRKQRDLSDLRWALAYGDRYAIKVRDLTLTCMIDICLANSEIEAPEISSIADSYGASIGSAIDSAELEALAEARQAEAAAPGVLPPFECLVACLLREQVQLDDNARELILEAAFRVACADSEIEPEQHSRLLAIAESLAIHPGVLELEIDRFQRRLAAA
jgi:tellurite resistance protein